MKNARFKELLDDYILGRLTDEAASEFLLMLDDAAMRSELEQLIDEQLGNHFYDQDIELPATHQRIVEKLQTSVSQKKTMATVPVHRIHFLKRGWLRYAAAILLFAMAGIVYLLLNHKLTGNKTVVQNFKHEIAPGMVGAVLTLADGSKIVLDTAGNGMIAAGIQKNDKGVVYTASTAITYNTLTTPKGRTISATLADGTVVWLNAGSSITFPTAFTGNRRTVSMTGEAYFEVAKDKTKPFIVKTTDQDIEVLGTHFNVNAYPDEASVKTTLLEGAVKIKGQVLKPGEQYSQGNITKVNTDNVIAWKNGYFNFDNADIQVVMRQMARWYDVEVGFEDKISYVPFGGEIGRNQTLSEVLKGLESMRIHFRIEDDKRIVVTP
jgi:ferric-dicitrate binding protein FerR (iron transport regulator)